MNIMLHTIKTYTIRTIASAKFWISVALCLLVLVAEGMPLYLDILFRGYSPVEAQQNLIYFITSFHFGYIIYAAPILCGFASIAIFCEDTKTRFLHSVISFIGKKRYAAGIWIAVTMCGGLSLALGIILFATIVSLILFPYMKTWNIALSDPWIIILQSHGDIGYFFVQAGLGFVFGSIWSGVGLVSSLIYPDRNISYLVPFIICFTLNTVLPNALQPLEMFVQLGWTDFTFKELLFYQSTLYLIILVGYVLSWNWRMKNV